MKTDYLENVKKQFENYKVLGEKTIVELPDEKLLWKYNESSHSIAAIVKHLWGNMLSRWKNFLTTSGEVEWSDREAEFYNDIKSRKELLDKWNEGWSYLFNSINSLREDDLQRIICIQNYEHTVAEAINMQLAHYSYYVGQIVLIGKLICDGLNSLTSPMEDPQKKIADKFVPPQYKGHWVEEYLRQERNKFV